MTPPLSLLDPLLGRWRSSGTVLDSHGRPDGEVSGTDTYSILPGEQWITHDVDVVVGAQHTLVREVIGGSHPGGGWLMCAFDDSAEPGFMRLSMHDSELVLPEEGGIRSWFHIRAGPDRMTARWERSGGNSWTTCWRCDSTDSIDHGETTDNATAAWTVALSTPLDGPTIR